MLVHPIEDRVTEIWYSVQYLHAGIVKCIMFNRNYNIKDVNWSHGTVERKKKQ